MNDRGAPSGATSRADGPGPSGAAALSAAAPADDDGLSLPAGTRFGEFEIRARRGAGGFSIVYRAWDHVLEREVALKEYLPSALAMRTLDGRIAPRSERYREPFDLGLRSFVNEAKLLARFDHPALAKVFRFWQDNDSAYMVMPFYEGRELKEVVRAMPAPPDEAWLLALLDPVTEALAVLHEAQCYHRDIAPDNVLILDGGQPVLLDFNAARRVVGDATQALTAILKAGYAPIEQYAEVPGLRQGAWTDLYALGAVLHWCITGHTPPDAMGRYVRDGYVPLAQAVAGRYGDGFLRAVDAALAVLPEARTPDVATFRTQLGLPPLASASATAPRTPRGGAGTRAGALPATTAARATAASTSAPTFAPTATADTGAVAASGALGATASSAAAGTGAAPMHVGVDDATVIAGQGRGARAATTSTSPSPAPTVVAARAAPATSAPSPMSRRAWLIGAALLVAGGGGAWVALRDSSPIPAPRPSPVPAPVPVPSSSPVPAPPMPAPAPEPSPSPPREPPLGPAPPKQPLPKAPPRKTDDGGRSASTRAECAQIAQQMSLGQGDPQALARRLQQLGCR